MNYLKVVLEALPFLDRLDRYFLDQYQKAEKEYITKIEFFNGCLEVVKDLKSITELKIPQREKELYLLFNKLQKIYKKEVIANPKLELSNEIKESINDLKNRLDAQKFSQSMTYVDLNKINSVIVRMKKQVINLTEKEEDFILTEERKQLLKRYIWPDKHPEFIEINKKFLQYWNNKKQAQKQLIFYLHYLVEKDYFRNVVDGKKFKDTHGKDFLSLYFYGDKLALSEAKKQNYRNITLRNNHLYTFLSI